jgi:NAD(P)-dependent dehydrogenase (short-subunit alcohol dehydrogenase family)
MKDFAGRTAFATGAASGIGLGICNALAKAGMNVALADINPEPLAAARDAVAAFEGKTIAIPLDVSDRTAMTEAAARVAAELGVDGYAALDRYQPTAKPD